MYNADKAFSMTDWSLGWDISSSPIGMDPRACWDCQNLILTPNRGLKVRGGVTKLFPAPVTAGTKVSELHEYQSPVGQMILAAAGTNLKYWDGAAWQVLKSGLTAGQRFMFAEHQGYCYVTNGVDPMFKLYGTDVSTIGIAAPTVAPTATLGATGPLSGSYQYVYSYERATPTDLIGNPSLQTDLLTVAGASIDVTVKASADTQVQYIVLYRTLNLDAGGDPTRFLMVTRLSNTDQTYNDTADDSALMTDVAFDQGPPPNSKFLMLNKDMVFYANCPDREDGGSLLVWSKAGLGEAVPALNYQYFDRKDGHNITGIAAVGDYIVVFKEKKLFVVPADFSSMYCFSQEIGCISGPSITQLEYEIVFLSEHGWFSFDGSNLYDLAATIRRPMIEEGYINADIPEAYYGVHYSLYDRFYCLCDHPTNTPRTFCGQLLIPLLYIRSGISKEAAENIVGWTYHEYPHQHLTSLAMMMDSEGVERMIAGAADGHVYQLDSGMTDDGDTIPYAYQSGWTSMKEAPTVFKTLRLALLSFIAAAPPNAQFVVEQDFLPAALAKNLSGGYAAYCGYCYCGDVHCGVSGSQINRFALGGKPTRLFRFSVKGDDASALQLQSLTAMYRIEGVR